MDLQLNIVEHVGKYYSLFVNKNYTALKDFYDKKEEYYLQHNVTFPVYCLIEFTKHKDNILGQEPETVLYINRTTLEDLLMEYPIK